MREGKRVGRSGEELVDKSLEGSSIDEATIGYN